jgi:hypothetical protein
MAKTKPSFEVSKGGSENSGRKKKEFPTGIAVGKRREKGNDDEVDYDRYFC